MDQSVAPGERLAWNQDYSAAHIGCARLVDDEEDEEEGPVPGTAGGRGERLWEKASFPPCVCVCV